MLLPKWKVKRKIIAILIKDYRLKGCMPAKITGRSVTGSCGYHTRQKKSQSRNCAVQAEFIDPRLTASDWLVFINNGGDFSKIPIKTGCCAPTSPQRLLIMNDKYY